MDNQFAFKNNDKFTKRAIIWYVVEKAYIAVSIFLTILFLFLFGIFNISNYNSDGSSTFNESNLFFSSIVLIIAIIILGLIYLAILITNLVMYANWAINAHKNAVVISGKDLFIPPSAHLAVIIAPTVSTVVLFLFSIIPFIGILFGMLNSLISLVCSVLAAVALWQIINLSSNARAKNLYITFLSTIAGIVGFTILFSVLSLILQSFGDDTLTGIFAVIGIVFNLLILSLGLFLLILFPIIIHQTNKGQNERSKEVKPIKI